jgi:hypothetical protein
MVNVRRTRLMRHGQSGFGHILAFLLVVVVLTVVGVAGVLVLKKARGDGLGGFHSPASEIAATMPDCQGDELLTQSPVKPEEMSTVVPIGNLAPPGHVLPTYHMYYNYIHTGGSDNHSLKTTLYVPADMTVTQMMKMDNADLDPPYEAYRIDFAICKQVTGYFILVQELSDKLAAAMQPPYDRTQVSDVGKDKKTHNWYKNVNVQLKAGEILGYAGGKVGDPSGLDMALVDIRKPKPTLANPERWSSSDLYYVCTLDYYEPSLSQQLYAKLGDFGGKLVADSSDCGSIYQDVPGTAQGVWLKPNASGLWDVRNVVALVHSNYDSSRGAFSLGTNAQDAGVNTSGVNYFTPATSGRVNLDFNLVKPGSTIYCYEVSTDSMQLGSLPTILLQLASDKLTIGAGNSTTCGTGPWTFDKTVEYVR